jgi:hypothetical protein
MIVAAEAMAQRGWGSPDGVGVRRRIFLKAEE